MSPSNDTINSIFSLKKDVKYIPVVTIHFKLEYKPPLLQGFTCT